MKRRILSTLLAFVMALSLLPGTALAADKTGTCGKNVTWTLNSAGVLTLSGTGNMSNNYSSGYSYWRAGTIKSVVIESGINSIGGNAFHERSALTKVSIPDTVTFIGKQAFASCTNLLRVTIPDSVTELGDAVFIGCSRLISATLPKDLETLGTNTFAACKSLTSLTLPDSLTSIGANAFSSCASLKSITIPKNVATIFDNAFKNCSGLTSVKFLGNLSSLGKYAFQGCTNLTSLELPSGLDYLDDGTFISCSNLASVTIPRSMETIGKKVFEKCTHLKDIYFTGTQEEWENIYIDASTQAQLASVKIHYNSGGSSSAKTYTVTFDPTGGKVTPASKEYKANATLGTLPNPTKTGYKFNGWYTAKTGGSKVTSSYKVAKDQTLYAQWTKNSTAAKVTIKLDANGGKVSPASISVTKNSTYLNLLPTPTRDGYTFDGWYTTKTGTTKITSATKAAASRTVYAHWTKDTGADEELTLLNVTFNANGGTVNQRTKQVIPTGRYKELPVPFRSGYSFEGWYTAKTGGVKITEKSRVTATKDQILYARWTSKAPTVKKNQSGSWTVSVPARCKVALYASASAIKTDSIQAGASTYRDIECTKRAELSNGTVRFYGKINGVNRWFSYSCEMDID